MVETSVLVLGAVIFFVILVAILRSGVSGESRTASKKKDKKLAKPNPQQQKPKQKRTRSLKKNERLGEPSEWVGVDTPQKDAEAVLEFLKGKDPAEIAKQHAIANRQATIKPRRQRKQCKNRTSQPVSLWPQTRVSRK